MEEVVLEVDTGEGFTVLAFDGEVLPVIVRAMGGKVSRTLKKGGRRRTLRAAWVRRVVAAGRKRGKMMAYGDSTSKRCFRHIYGRCPIQSRSLHATGDLLRPPIT